MSNIKFEWDPRKASANEKKHGISFEEARTVFFDENAKLIDDPDHSDDEERFVLLGLSSSLKVVLVCHSTDKDLERAFALYMEAAKKKSIRAGYKVGMAYMWGEGVEEDIPAAAYWFKQAANGGDDDAQVQLGMMFIYGHGVEENVDKGFNWLQLSAEQDNPIALRELGFLHENGKGVALSMSEATRLISKAASLGDKKSIEWVDTHYPDKPDWLKTLCLDTSLKG